MILRAMIGVAAFAALATAAAADEPNDKQRNVMHHAASVMAGVHECDDFELSEPLVTFAMLANGVDPKDIQPGGKFFGVFFPDYSETRQALQKAGRAAACITLDFLYGEKGQNVPGMVRRK